MERVRNIWNVTMFYYVHYSGHGKIRPPTLPFIAFQMLGKIWKDHIFVEPKMLLGKQKTCFK